MYKEALIRNTYQGILANRPRDLTEEELEALELDQLRIGVGEEGSVDRSEGPREGVHTPTVTEANNTQHNTPSSVLRVGLGLPPLSGHCPDSPMSLKAAQSTSATWRHTVCLNTASTTTSHQQQRTQLLYTPVSMATGGETMTDRVSYTNNTEAGSVMSWVQDDEDAFYEQLAEEELPKTPTTQKQRGARKPSEEEDAGEYHPHHTDQPKKGGRNGKKRSGGGGNQWRDVKKGATPSGGGKPNPSASVALSGGRFDALRR